MSFFIELEQEHQNFESALQECYETIFDKDHSPEDNAADFFIALLQSHKKYIQEQQRLERIKSQANNSDLVENKKGKKAKGKGNFAKAQNSYTENTASSALEEKINYISAGLDAHIAGALSVRLANEKELAQTYRPIDELSNKNSIFCDYFSVLEQIYTIRNKGSISNLYKELLEQDSFYTLCITLAIYNSITTSALNRTIIHCSEKSIDDDILTNSCDVFTKLPQWAISLDFNKCPIPFASNKITGLILSRQTVFSKKGNSTAGPSKVEAEPEVFYNNLCLTICCDNKRIFSTDVELLLNSESSVENLVEQIQKGAIEYLDSIRAHIKDSKDEEHNNLLLEELNDDFYMVQLSKDECIKSIKQAMKHVVYFLTHQNELKDSKGQSVVLENTPFASLKGNDFYQLKNKVPFNSCFI